MTFQSKAVLCDKYREINVDYKWWGDICRDWTDKLDPLGIITEPRKMYFSGFWCQGDGASFTGDLRLAVFVAAHPDLAARFPAHAKLISTFPADWWGTLTNVNARYCHEGTVRLEMGGGVPTDIDDPVMAGIVDALAEGPLPAEVKDFEEEVLSLCRRYMSDLYRDLEKEYEYITSDDVIWASLVVAGMHKEQA